MLKYLARYTHRVAISNSRLLASTSEGTVTFRYKDYADASRHKTMTLSAEEFLRRFVQHVLPKGFFKIRHYGLLANRGSAEKLHLCRRLLLPLAATADAPAAAPQASTEDACPIDKAKEPHCPNCGSGRLLFIALPKAAPGASAATTDTS